MAEQSTSDAKFKGLNLATDDREIIKLLRFQEQLKQMPTAIFASNYTRCMQVL